MGTSGESPLTIKTFTPTGGVTAPIVVTRVITTANQTGSNPSACERGKKIGMVTTRKPNASIRQPPTRYISSTTTRMASLGTFSDAAQSASSKGSRVTVKNLPKITAPVINMTTIAEVLIVSVIAFANPCFDSFLLVRPIRKAPKDPAAPASVGVNHPA